MEEDDIPVPFKPTVLNAEIVEQFHIQNPIFYLNNNKNTRFNNFPISLHLVYTKNKIYYTKNLTKMRKLPKTLLTTNNRGFMMLVNNFSVCNIESTLAQSKIQLNI